MISREYYSTRIQGLSSHLLDESDYRELIDSLDLESFIQKLRMTDMKTVLEKHLSNSQNQQSFHHSIDQYFSINWGLTSKFDPEGINSYYVALRSLLDFENLSHTLLYLSSKVSKNIIYAELSPGGNIKTAIWEELIKCENLRELKGKILILAPDLMPFKPLVDIYTSANSLDYSIVALNLLINRYGPRTLNSKSLSIPILTDYIHTKLIIYILRTLIRINIEQKYKYQLRPVLRFLTDKRIIKSYDKSKYTSSDSLSHLISQILSNKHVLDSASAFFSKSDVNISQLPTIEKEIVQELIHRVRRKRYLNPSMENSALYYYLRLITQSQNLLWLYYAKMNGFGLEQINEKLVIV